MRAERSARDTLHMRAERTFSFVIVACTRAYLIQLQISLLVDGSARMERLWSQVVPLGRSWDNNGWHLFRLVFLFWGAL